VSVQGDRAVEIARAWIGTPYRHQASMCQAGADCLGLLRGVWRELYGAEPELAPTYTQDWSEAGREERLWAAAQRHLLPAVGAQAKGQVILFRMREGAVAKHLGLLSAVDRFIHAYCGHGVVESPLTTAWNRRVVARFEFP
jgi:NlpC/P60 family putative phage cell wall peptidase